MKHSPRFGLVSLIVLAGCATAPLPPPRASSRRHRVTSEVTSPPTPPTPSAPSAPIDVRATPSNPLEFNISAGSDLPPTPTSTAQPFERRIESAVAPLRPALAECLRSLGAPARRVVRVTIDEEGTLHQRPPQDFTLGARDASCLDGVLRAATVEPAPPRLFPFDLRVDVAQ